MNNDPARRPTFGQPNVIPQAGHLKEEAPANLPQLPVGPPPPTTESAKPMRPKIWPGMTPQDRQAYIEGTISRGSRKKVRPSLDQHRDLLIDCVRGRAVMKIVFDDLVAIDPAILEEFKPDGYRAFNACVKRMAEV